MKSIYLNAILIIMLLALASCVPISYPTQKSSTGSSYQVKSGDTLYSIAWRYGLDYKRLASWNGIAVNSIIKPGQRLKLYQPRIPEPTQVVSKSSETPVATKNNLPTKTVQPTDVNAKSNRWIWPTKGVILNTFSVDKLDKRGIDIAGKLGQPVYATAGGRVVYSGNGLSGYGNLIIIKHSDTYLSAYAYCQQRFVKDGMQVRGGAIIAKMGRHKTTTARLHFEIRKNGIPVDPLNYLPKR